MKKQIIGLFLLFILIVPAVVTYTWIQHHKYSIKREVKEKLIAGIDIQELVFFQFSNEELTTQLRWEHAKEFEYKSQMYDVVDKKIYTDSTYLYCWLDHKETKLNKQLQSLLDVAFQNDNQTTQKEEQALAFYKFLYFQPEFSWQPFVFSDSKTTSNLKVLVYQTTDLSIAPPPPKISIS